MFLWLMIAFCCQPAISVTCSSSSCFQPSYCSQYIYAPRHKNRHALLAASSKQHEVIITSNNEQHNDCGDSSSSSSKTTSKVEQYMMMHHHQQRAKDLVTMLASDRTWRRLSHVYELTIAAAVSNNCRGNSGGGTCVDVGCDHGLLAIALASSGQFTQVSGTDVSPRALKDGAMANYERAMSLSVADIAVVDPDGLDDHSLLSSLPVLQSQMEFVVADGITDFEPGQADTICICGLGVYTILQILCPDSSHSSSGNDALSVEANDHNLLDRLGCTHLVLQPTGTDTRPRNMIKLYDELRKIGWGVSEERIEYISSRWYITTSFARSRSLVGSAENDFFVKMPGESISQFGANAQNCTNEFEDNVGKDLVRMYAIYQNYVSYHKEFLQEELQVKPSLYENDKRWLQFCQDQGSQ